MKRRAEIATGTLLLIAGVGLLIGWIAPKPKIFDSRSREAAESAAVSAQVEKAVSAEIAALSAKGATVAASVQQIGVAAGQLPDSPQREFIVRESGWVAPLLPPPDPVALLAAERRRVAILEGKLELADKLYTDGTKANVALIERATKAETKLTKELADRREVDTQLAESAAYARGKDAVIGLLSAVVVLAVLAWLYVRARAGKLTGLLGKIMPTLDAAYEDAPEPTKQALDASIFDRLSKVMDKADKNLVHLLRAKQ